MGPFSFAREHNLNPELLSPPVQAVLVDQLHNEQCYSHTGRPRSQTEAAGTDTIQPAVKKITNKI